MNWTDEDILWIDKAIQGLLSPDEEEQFQSKLKDPNFKEAYLWHQQAAKGSKLVERDRLKSSFNSWEEEDRIGQEVSSFRIPWRAVAAVVLLVLCVGVVWYFAQNPKDHFAASLDPYPNVVDPILKGSEEGLPSLTQLYELGRYSDVLRQDINSIEQEFYVALSALHLGDLETATGVLSRLSNQNAFRFQQESQWYLALALGMQDQKEACKELLAQIAKNGSHPYSNQAELLISQAF